jgi:hypothetical protein
MSDSKAQLELVGAESTRSETAGVTDKLASLHQSAPLCTTDAKPDSELAQTSELCCRSTEEFTEARLRLALESRLALSFEYDASYANRTSHVRRTGTESHRIVRDRASTGLRRHPTCVAQTRRPRART